MYTLIFIIKKNLILITAFKCSFFFYIAQTNEFAQFFYLVLEFFFLHFDYFQIQIQVLKKNKLIDNKILIL